jgi:BNR repeat-like domain
MKKNISSGIICLSVFLFCLTAEAAWTTKRLTFNTGVSSNPHIATYGANIYLVWSDDTPGNGELYFKKSVNGGSTWQQSIRLSINSGASFCPAIAVSGAHVFVVWEDGTSGNDEIYFRNSLDGGATWQVSKRLTYTAGLSAKPEIAVSGSNVYVVYSDNTSGNHEVFFRKSTDNGAHWQNPNRLTFTAGDSGDTEIAVNGADICVVWTDNTSGNPVAFFRRSTDGGVTWKAALRFSPLPPYYARLPSVAVDEQNVYVVWQQRKMDYTVEEIYFKKSTDGGASWQAGVNLSNNITYSCIPDVAFIGTNVYVVWTDMTGTTVLGCYDIRLKKSANRGADWQSTLRLTSNDGDSSVPAVAVNDTNIYVTWQDDTPGNREIYLKYSPLL